jgi:Cu/Ag efflux protein CusF
VRRGAVAFAMLAASAAMAAAQAPQEYRGTGVVLAVMPPPSSLHATRPVIVLQHEPIAGLMDEEMSMPFMAASDDLLREVRPGDRVAFVLRDTPGALLVISLRRLTK